MNRTNSNKLVQNGFTLIELLIAMAITAIITTAIYTAYQSQQKSYLEQDQVAGMQQNLRAAMNIMEREIRMAGYDPHDGNSGAGIIATGDGGNGNPFSFTLVADNDGVDNNNDGTIDEIGELKTIQYDLYDAYTDGDTDIGRRVGAGNRQPIAENIEVLNFVYLDENRNTPVANLEDIRAVQVTIVARTDGPAQGCTDNRVYRNQQGTIVLDKSTAPDNFRRRILSTEITCRNMGLEQS